MQVSPINARIERMLCACRWGRAAAGVAAAAAAPPYEQEMAGGRDRPGVGDHSGDPRDRHSSAPVVAAASSPEEIERRNARVDQPIDQLAAL